MTFFSAPTYRSQSSSGTGRSIVHLNIADFAVAVERRIEARLKDYPVIIAPAASARAMVYDMSEEAFCAGVRKQMPLNQALRRCRDAVILPPHPDRYEQAMAEVFQQTLPYSPLIETGTADGHVFIDVTGTRRLFGPPVDVAWRMYHAIKKHLGFAPAWSVCPNKLVAKTATRLVKPVGEYIVGQGEESDFLAPLPLFLIPGIEKNDIFTFRSLNISCVSQAAALRLDQLRVVFGRRADFLFNILKGRDAAPVLPAGQKPLRVSANHVFATDTNDVQTVADQLYQLTETLGAELRALGRAARNLAMVLDYSDGVRRIRQIKVDPPSANDFFLFQCARSLLALAWTRRVRVRHIRLICEKPVFPPAQMDLFPDPVQQKQQTLISAMDRIRERYGREAICMGRSLKLKMPIHSLIQQAVVTKTTGQLPP